VTKLKVIFKPIIQPLRFAVKASRNLFVAATKFVGSLIWEALSLLTFGKRLWIRIKWPPKYYRSAHWKEVRRKAFEHYGRKCAVCGASHRLQVHHIHYRRNGRSVLGREDIEKDLRVLCRKHHPKGAYSHAAIERDRKAYKWYGRMLK